MKKITFILPDFTKFTVIDNIYHDLYCWLISNFGGFTKQSVEGIYKYYPFEKNILVFINTSSDNFLEKLHNLTNKLKEVLKSLSTESSYFKQDCLYLDYHDINFSLIKLDSEQNKVDTQNKIGTHD